MIAVLLGLFFALIVLYSGLTVVRPTKQANTESIETLREAPEYVAQSALLTPPEADAFRYLCQHIANSAHICPKVRIADILKVDRTDDRQAWGRAFGKIAQKHVDFVIMDHIGKILFALEVDDSSHSKPARQRRDTFVNNAFKPAGIPLLRVRSGKLDRSDTLANMIKRLNQQVPQALKVS